VGHLRFGGAVSGLDRESSRAPVMRTPAGLLKRLGRVLLWVLVVVLLLRGLVAVVAPREPAAVVPSLRPASPAWPDDEARAFAADFARVYLSYSPRDPEGYVRGLQAFVAPELAGSIAPEFAEDAERQAVGAVTVARSAVLDDRHALVTVAATVTGETVATRYLAVPVARDGRGGLVVSDLPSFAAPPARASDARVAVEPLAGAERAGIEDVLSRFFAAYLAGDARELEYLVPAGVRIGALGQRHELLEVVSLSQGAPPAGREREVLATVRARDVVTRAVYPLRYRLRLVRRDRWYVAAVNTTTRQGG
jgi:hypothetical protein